MENKYKVFMKGEGISVLRNFKTDEEDWQIRFYLDEECDAENMEIQWIKVNGKKINIKTFGSNR